MPRSFISNNSRPHLILAGDVVDTLRGSGLLASGHSVARKAVSVGSMEAGVFMENIGSSEDQYPNTAMVSLDAIFSPYSVISHTLLPSFSTPTDLDSPNALTLNPWNPNNSIPTGTHFNQWMNSGHNITMACVGSGLGSGETEDFTFEKDFFGRQKVETKSVRGIGLRAPIILTGWGFDTDGKPVPADPNDADKFHPSGFWEPSLWPAGPVDLRWDAARGVWTAGGGKTYLIKITNTYNPACFSYEVERSASRSQFTRDTLSPRSLDLTGPIYDPEQVAYDANPDNIGCFERLDFDGAVYPHYEGFIIRETTEESSTIPYYNIFTEDCSDCGHISNQCASGTFTRHGMPSVGKKVLIENPLKQGFNVGDLAFAVKTGRSKNVNTGSFTGGSGTGASGNVVTDASGNLVSPVVILSSGSGYTYGAFAIPSGNVCLDVSLAFSGGVLSLITVSPSGGFRPSEVYPLRIYPNDAVVSTESLPIMWVLNSEYRTSQLNTYTACDGGLLQTCSKIISHNGFSSCEWCGEDLTLVNNQL